MKTNKVFLLAQKVVNSINQLRKASNDWGKGEEFYNRIYTDKIMSQISKNFSNKRTLRIFDGGCGTGRFSIALAQMGYDVTGIDIHGPSINTARMEAKRVNVKLNLIKRDLLTSLKDTQDNYYDVAICLGVLYTCTQYQDIIKEIYRVVKKKGIFLASFRTKFYFITTLLRQKKYEKALYVAENSDGLLKIASVPTYYNWQSLEEVDQLYKRNGFEMIDVASIGMFTGAGIDGMAAITDVENITDNNVYELLHKIETYTQNEHSSMGRFILATGQKNV